MVVVEKVKANKMNDIETYMVEVGANVELAPIAIKLFETFEAFWVPDSAILTYGSKDKFTLLVAVYSEEALTKLRGFTAVKGIYKNTMAFTC